ncbi:methanogenic corrinoid protein MtbC1 [Roseiarcus fermentans]|uniref:Methanogenic corrinoid protein MtbC1 n=1 Tax=Roseiarcus fermentans TaxID=1473586 RepID=A0A366F9H7_9HYPH|nr:cobalamin B12-binding domain-containing protein [Roseiarcus fermentans]RBP11322.1 methanogenic corrinoid protein MtbC1 [Roseiarcus fermentans]
MTAGGGIFQDLSDVCFAPFARTAPAHSRPVSRARDAKPALKDIVETDIGPRLFQFHHESIAVAPPESRPAREDIERLARLVIGNDEAATAAHFEKVCAQHHAYATLLAYFVAPAARLLGEFWEQDICDFFEVTVGVGRLQAFMDRLATPEPLSAADARRKVLLVSLPGETHLLGIRIVAKVLEAAGWDVTVEEQAPAEHNARTAAREWFGVVGVTVSAEARVELAARTVATIRSASLNRHVAFMAGGRALVEQPELALRIGAEAAGFDAPTAPFLASHLLMRQTAMM